MARPTLVQHSQYFTTGEIAKRLGLSRKRLYNRINSQLLPEPTTRGIDGLMLFDQSWLDRAKVLLMAESKLISPEQRDSALSELEGDK